MLIKENKFSEKLIYLGFKQKNKIKIYFGIGLNRIIRETFLIFHKNMRSATENVALKLIRIFQAHGSFITFSEEAIKRLWNGKDVNYTGVFDENMFLFSEEGVIARRAKLLNVPVYYSNFAICDHKEDGSMKISGLNLNSELTKSNIYYYERYCMRKNRNIKFYD